MPRLLRFVRNTESSNTSWSLDGTPSAYADGETVYFSNGDGVDKNVTIAGNVAPGRINVSGTDFIFTGDGSITGDTTLNLLDGASLTMNNANSYAGDTVLGDGSKLVVGNAGALGNYKGQPAVGPETKEISPYMASDARHIAGTL